LKDGLIRLAKTGSAIKAFFSRREALKKSQFGFEPRRQKGPHLPGEKKNNPVFAGKSRREVPDALPDGPLG
jgi:hypothetical protein